MPLNAIGDTATIQQAFVGAQYLRPYKADARLLSAIVPAGGEWLYERNVGSHITWNGLDVAHVNPSCHIDPATEVEIAMALRAAPAMDAALRAILTLARSTATDQRGLIARIAETVIAHIEETPPGFAGVVEEES